jgi:adenosylcobinamide amidohydrolase
VGVFGQALGSEGENLKAWRCVDATRKIIDTLINICNINFCDYAELGTINVAIVQSMPLTRGQHNPLDRPGPLFDHL